MMPTRLPPAFLAVLAAGLGGCIVAVPAQAPSASPAAQAPVAAPPAIVARPAARAPKDRWGKADVATRQDLAAVCAPSGLVAIAVGAKGTVTKTVDGGATWTVLTPPALAADDLQDVAFLDARTGWALGKQALYLTADGGETWTKQDLFADLDPYGRPETGEISLVSYEKGAFVARGHVFTTTDGGKTFTKILAPEPVAGSVKEAWQVAAHLVAMGDGYGLWNGFGLFRLDGTAPAEGGTAPSKAEAFPERTDAVALTFASPTEGWAVVAGAGQATLRRSTDGGRTWTGSPIKSALAAGTHPTMGFPVRAGKLQVFGGQAFLLGRGPSGAVVMAESKDAGLSWTVSEAVDNRITDIAVPDATHGYGVGPGGMVWSVTSN